MGFIERVSIQRAAGTEVWNEKTIVYGLTSNFFPINPTTNQLTVLFYARFVWQTGTTCVTVRKRYNSTGC